MYSLPATEYCLFVLELRMLRSQSISWSISFNYCFLCTIIEFSTDVFSNSNSLYSCLENFLVPDVLFDVDLCIQKPPIDGRAHQIDLLLANRSLDSRLTPTPVSPQWST
jgi:hypothetical protein